MEFSRQEYCSGFLCPPLGDLPHPGIESVSPVCSTLQADSLQLCHSIQFSSVAQLCPTLCNPILYLYRHNRNCLRQIASTSLNQTNDHFIYLMAYNQYFTQPIIPSFLKDFLPFTWLPGYHPLLDVLLSHCFLASFANSCIISKTSKY